MIGEIGFVSHAINRRAEKTRPCTSGATFDCQMAWFEPLISGPTNAPSAEPASQTGIPPKHGHRQSAPDPTAQNAMRAALKASPRTHQHSTDQPADRTRCLHRAENQTITFCARQYHGRQHGIANPREQVAHEEDQLQAKQAGSGKDIFEAVRGFFQHSTFTLFAFLGA
jgi:hypothetical protein